MADTRDGGFSEETEDLLWHSVKSLQQGLLICFAAFLWVHHVHKLLGGSLEVLQLLLLLLLLFAQCLDLLKAVGDLLFNIGDYLLQPLDVICTMIQHIFRIQDKLLSERTRGKKGLALVRLLLFFELFLELGVGLLKIAEVILEEPCFSRPLQLQLVELSLKIYVLRLLF
jgi:hypothetical protein